MSRILIPTDFSDNAIKTVDYILDMFAGDLDAEFILINSYEVIPSNSNTMLISITEILQKDSEDGLKKAAIQLSQKGRKVRTISMHGSLVDSINELVREENVDLIVMGTHGASGLEKFLMGSNTAEVAKSVKKPLLVVPSVSKFKRPGKILFATDFKGPFGEGGLQSLKDFARMFGAEIVVFNVHKKGESINMAKATSESGLEEGLRGVKLSYHEVTGDKVVQALYDTVKKLNLGFIAIVAHQHSFFGEIFHKSLTSEMTMGTNVPMLVLHD